MIASSGAGAVEHFSDVFNESTASAALAAGIFHRKEVSLNDYMIIYSEHNICICDYRIFCISVNFRCLFSLSRSTCLGKVLRLDFSV